MSKNKVQILITDDAESARKDFCDYFRDEYILDFVDTITSLDEFLYVEEGYKTYAAIMIDLNLDMPNISRERLKKEIPEFKNMDKPIQLEGNIPLYGFDYFTRVILTRPETQQMVNEGRIILFSGHAAKIRKEGLFTNEKYPHTQLIDRAEGGTEILSQLIKNIIADNDNNGRF